MAADKGWDWRCGTRHNTRPNQTTRNRVIFPPNPTARSNRCQLGPNSSPLDPHLTSDSFGLGSSSVHSPSPLSDLNFGRTTSSQQLGCSLGEAKGEIIDH